MSQCIECNREAVKRGFCHRCYMRHRRAGTMPPKPEPDRTCRIANGECSDDYMAKGLCKRHYFRQYTQGTTELTTLLTAPDDVRYRASVNQGDPGECWPWTATVISTTGYGSLYWDGTSTSAHIAGWELATGLIPANFWVDHACHNKDLSCPGREACLHRRCQNPLHLEAVTPVVNLARSSLTTAHQGWIARGADERELEALTAQRPRIMVHQGWVARNASKEELDALIVTMAIAGVNGTWQRPDCPRGHRLSGANLIRHPERGTIGCRECMSRTKRFRGHRLLQLRG